MAIERYVFSNTGSAGIQELKTWMEQNASEYFDSFTIDVVNTEIASLTCKIGEVNALTLSNMSGYNSSSDKYTLKVTLKNGQSLSSACLLTYSSIVRAYKTSHGILLVNNKSESVFVTKTNDDTLAFAAIRYSATTTNPQYYQAFIGEYEKSSGFQSVSGDTAGWEYIKNEVATPAGKTVLVPMCFQSGTYAENLFKMAFSEYSGTECQFDLNGTKYVTNGFFALKE